MKRPSTQTAGEDRVRKLAARVPEEVRRRLEARLGLFVAPVHDPTATKAMVIEISGVAIAAFLDFAGPLDEDTLWAMLRSVPALCEAATEALAQRIARDLLCDGHRLVVEAEVGDFSGATGWSPPALEQRVLRHLRGELRPAGETS